jgi:hypothetical protein
LNFFDTANGAVRRPVEELRQQPVVEQRRRHPFENHESFLVCDGKSPIRIQSNYPVSNLHLHFHNILAHNVHHKMHNNKIDKNQIRHELNKIHQNHSNNKNHQLVIERHYQSNNNHANEMEEESPTDDGDNNDNININNGDNLIVINDDENFANNNDKQNNTMHIIDIYHYVLHNFENEDRLKY